MKLLTDKGEQIFVLHLGTVPVGKTREYVYYIENDTPSLLTDIKIEIGSKEVEIVEVPTRIEARKRGKFVIKWTPTLKIKAGLRASVKLTGTEIWS